MIAFSIGPINIYRYGIFYFIGFIIGYIFIQLISKNKFFENFPTLQKILRTQSDDIFIALILGGILGGRVGHILIYDLSYYIQHPQDIIAIRKGGMSFIGGIIGACIGLLIFKHIKKLKYKDLLLLIDTIIVVVPIGIMLGRIGNYLNQELYGIIVSPSFIKTHPAITNTLTQINIFHIYSQIDQQLRINTNILASISEGLIGFILLSIATYKRMTTPLSYKKIFHKPGFITGLFLTRYSMIRFILEYIRQDSQSEFIGFFSKSQYFFIIFFILGIIIIRKSQHYDTSTK